MRKLVTTIYISRDCWADGRRWRWEFSLNSTGLHVEAGNRGYKTRFGAHRAACRIAERLGITVRRINEDER
jgi:hypothetical protein